jgi:hypothetical protein
VVKAVHSQRDLFHATALAARESYALRS